MIYLDNSATTPICKDALEAWELAAKCFGNPSSTHFAGIEAKKLLEGAREELTRAAGITRQSGRTVFTSSGSEANNLALFCTLMSKSYRYRPKIITTDSEHPSVLEPLRRACDFYTRFGKEPPEVFKLSTVGGVIDMAELASALDERTVLVSIMHANNETGALYDIKNAFSAVRRLAPSALTHTDAVQAFLKQNYRYDPCVADLISISGHKIGAPKGIGALVISERVIKERRIIPSVEGGGQEFGIRSGTQNLPHALAFAAAAKVADPVASYAHCTKLREGFISSLDHEIKLNTPKGAYLPNIISITLPHIKSETALNFLSQNGVCISSGSACASNGKHKSHALSAFGLTDSEADSTLRISLSKDNTQEELAVCAELLNKATKSLVRFK